MKSKKMSYHKVPNSYNKLNKRVFWLSPKENALVSTNRKLYSDTSIAVDLLSVDLSLTIEYTNPLNRRASEASIALFPSLSCKTPIATQLAGVNMSLVGQPASINMPMPHGQDMEKSAKPMIEPSAILYDNNQLVDPDLWNSLFALVLLLSINKFLSSNVQNITCLLLEIGILITQHSLSDKLTMDFLKLADNDFQ